ncbi:MAG TPA: hypothetical protein VKF59_16490 [Candidatus Dormibacteraeota bacterium]|nr:hypothetical protein [Candidatus Dormibacteraeota bacterium]
MTCRLPQRWAGIAAAAVLAAACSGQTVPGQPPPPFASLTVAPTMHSYHVPGVIGLPVSIVQVDDGYLLCDYVALYHLVRTSSGYTIKTLGPPAVPVWAPTGLAYRDGVLVVANYLGHDVLKLRLRGDTLTLVQRITDPSLQEPENVVTEADGSVLAADYQGNGLLRFRPDGTLQWRVPLGQAHGVTESGGYIYASSLLLQTIAKIDPFGNVVKTAGSPGASIGQYLWPVGLSDVGDRIAVTDALNGRITLLDHDLKVVGHAGANGAGLDALNFPYATLPVADGYVIVDSSKQRLVHTDRSWVVQDQVAMGAFVPVGRRRPLVYGSDARPYTYDMLPGVDVPATLGLRKPLPFVGAYDGLDHVGSRGAVTHLDLIDPQLGSTSAMWAQMVGNYIVIGSPESQQLLVVDPATGMFTGVTVGLDTWWRAGTLLGVAGVRRDLSEVIRPAQAAFAKTAQLLAQGVSPQDAFNQALSGGQARSFASDLSSAGGQEFLRSDMGTAAADRYFAWALQQPRPRVIEMLEVRYLSHASHR